MKVQEINLNNIKYAILIQGGGWVYQHTLYLITNDGDVYLTEDFINEEITPNKKTNAYYLGKVNIKNDFIVPKKLHLSVCDYPDVYVFDSSLDKPIYKAYGCEKEYKDYFKEVEDLVYEFEKEYKTRK